VPNLRAELDDLGPALDAHPVLDGPLALLGCPGWPPAGPVLRQQGDEPSVQSSLRMAVDVGVNRLVGDAHHGVLGVRLLDAPRYLLRRPALQQGAVHVASQPLVGFQLAHVSSVLQLVLRVPLGYLSAVSVARALHPEFYLPRDGGSGAPELAGDERFGSVFPEQGLYNHPLLKGQPLVLFLCHATNLKILICCARLLNSGILFKIGGNGGGCKKCWILEHFPHPKVKSWIETKNSLIR